jgi:hypothetical protein
VAAVQHAKFGFFITVHLRRNTHAALGQQGAASAGSTNVARSPIPKRFRCRAPQSSFTPKASLACSGHFVSGCGHDAIDHAARETRRCASIHALNAASCGVAVA